MSYYPSEGIMRVKLLCPLPAISFVLFLLAWSYVAKPLPHRTHACHQRHSRATSLEIYSSLRIPWEQPDFFASSYASVTSVHTWITPYSLSKETIFPGYRFRSPANSSWSKSNLGVAMLRFYSMAICLLSMKKLGHFPRAEEKLLYGTHRSQ